MDIMFYFKGENGKIEHKGPYSFDDKALKKLQTEFEGYCTGRNKTQGGSYECTWDNKPRVVFLKFDEILYLG